VATAQTETIPMRQTFDGTTWTSPRNLEDWSWDFAFESGSRFWLAQCCCMESGCNVRLIENNVSQPDEPRNLRDLAFDSRGNLWAASDNDRTAYAQGVWFRDGSSGEWTQVTPSTTPAHTMVSDRVRTVLPWGGDVWIGYREDGLIA
jgi:hypothetical protein